MPSTDSLGTDVTRADGTLVGSAVEPADAVALAAAIHGREGGTVFVGQAGTPVAWVGSVQAAPIAPPVQMGIAADQDAENPQQFLFTVTNAPAVAGIDFGDGESDTLAAGEQTIIHSYADAGTFRVVAVSGSEQAEVYVTSGPAVELPLQLLSLEPSSAEIGSADVTLVCNGSGFEPGATINFNGGDEPTAYLSETQVTTLVKPSTASGPWTLPVYVRNPDGGQSGELEFSFTEPEPAPEP